ncbi:MULTISPECIES: hypothetical protein [Methylobacterium]|uniref:PhiE125 gp8 family phage protein n=3 Tax=Pseudomonadota TaxID=1224 RepID=A0ABQ4SQT9_9HYPH|nr:MULTISPECIES: hypothetical protein [Methylobacterium]PIU07427.1 MAG: hypothetical protein COT56_05005 [Methylobacterium sp. CG09_land_8_20_14_0_10_71_15]PIU13963.1 MAG: hypothetical protein COT28_09470 [Methylobacterium sp. CG08_land_8_20_14_0_20_71_15]GBU17341.1 hypothetical protein AwMethylo_15560 [Methylobacterium sp.]GJE05535.1 hypothetical protein AOPFMNJM_0835 [Methylobacterium jeotgali]
MTPIRVESSVVEPVSVAEMRAYLRLDPDDGGAEDALIGSLIGAARAALERETRRLLVPGRYRIALPSRPPDGILPLPLSPLAGVTRAALAEAGGALSDLPEGSVQVGSDGLEGPCLLFASALPPLGGRTLLVEVEAGFGTAAFPLPLPLALAIRRLAAGWFEHRGDEPEAGLPATVAALLAPYRWRRL